MDILYKLMVLVSAFVDVSEGAKECDWELWDDAWQGRGVRPVDVDCAKGHIEWHGPYGGLFIKVQGPNSDYQLCLQAYSNHTSAVIMIVREESMETILQLNETVNSTSVSKSTICFPAKGYILLFVEPNIGAPVSSRVVIDYDLEEAPKYGDEACRPCSDEELLFNYCTSDFVAIGRMLGVYQKTVDTIIPVAVDYVKQQAVKYFSRSPEASGKLHGRLYAPAKCGMHYGPGQFVFMGKIRFGKAHLRCAPTYEDYHHLQSTARLKGTLLCS